MLSGIWRSTWRPAQDIRFQHCTQCEAVEQRRQQAVDTVIQPVLREARRAPSIQLPEAASTNKSRQPQHDATHASPDASDVNTTVYPSATGPAARRIRASAEPLELQKQRAAPMPSRKIRPSRMDFEVMYQQLDDWKQRHMTAHVPRYCFDAPELGAWVRKMRKQYKDGELEHWKVERLNLLQFEWEITDQDARWHHLYHQLRRYQLMHGSTDVDTNHNENDGCDWSQVAWWLRKQARLLAKQKLNSHHHTMLSQLGVTLRIPKRIVTRTAALQALNGPERRKLRKKWKHLDAAAADAAWEQQQQKLEQQQEQQRQQEDIASRRLMLLQDAAEAGIESSDQNQFWERRLSAGGSSYGVQGNINGSSSSSSVTQLLQQQYLAHMGLLQHDFQQQQHYSQEWRAEPSSALAAAGAAAAAAAADAGSSNSQQHSAGGREPGTIGSRIDSSWNGTSDIVTAPAAAAAGSGTHHYHKQSMRHPPKGVTSEAGVSELSPVTDSTVDHLQQQHNRQQQQQQQQQPGLLYQRNRHYKRVSRSTKQERWISAK